MTRICFVCNWGASSADLLAKYSLQTPRNAGRWNTICGTTDVNRADWIICMEDLPGNFYQQYPHIDPDRILFFAREPEWISPKQWYRHPSPYKFDFSSQHMLSLWLVEKDFDTLRSHVYAPRSREILCITSNKKSCRGQKIRVKFVKDFCGKYPGVMDVYGIGMQDENIGGNFKGSIRYGTAVKGVIENKFAAMSGYRYALCIENGSTPNYFTEKIADSFLSLSFPIYWGCPNLDSYFPQDSFAYVDITAQDAAERVREISSRPLTGRNIEVLREARDLVMYKYNLWPTLERIVNTIS